MYCIERCGELHEIGIPNRADYPPAVLAADAPKDLIQAIEERKARLSVLVEEPIETEYLCIQNSGETDFAALHYGSIIRQGEEKSSVDNAAILILARFAGSCAI